MIGDGVDQDCDGSDQNVEISVGRYTTCGIYAGEVVCWGNQPEVVPQSANPLTLQVGTYKDPFGCMLTSTKEIQCWGQFSFMFFLEDYGALEVGSRHACALKSKWRTILSGKCSFP